MMAQKHMGNQQEEAQDSNIYTYAIWILNLVSVWQVDFDMLYQCSPN